MKGYSIRLKFGMQLKDFYFQIEDNGETDKKWEEACDGLEEVGDSCTDAPEFFDKVVKHYATFGFERVAK